MTSWNFQPKVNSWLMGVEMQSDHLFKTLFFPHFCIWCRSWLKSSTSNSTFKVFWIETTKVRMFCEEVSKCQNWKKVIVGILKFLKLDDTYCFQNIFFFIQLLLRWAFMHFWWWKEKKRPNLALVQSVASNLARPSDVSVSHIKKELLLWWVLASKS